MHAVIETEGFAGDCKSAGVTEDEKHQITIALATNPLAGELIDTGGARKWRFARPGMGKRSGYRVISYYAGEDIPVFLLGLLMKGERVNMSMAEKRELKKTLATIAADYRANVKGLRWHDWRRQVDE